MQAPFKVKPLHALCTLRPKMSLLDSFGQAVVTTLPWIPHPPFLILEAVTSADGSV